MINMILATGENGELGLKGKLPWDCQEDLDYFNSCTIGSPVIMGNATFEGLPFSNGFPERKNYVLTTKTIEGFYGEILPCRSIFFGNRDSYICNLDFIENLLTYYTTHRDIWIVGGKSIYEKLLPFVEEIHHTTIKGNYNADTFMDISFLKEWTCVEEIELSDMASVKVYNKME